MNLDSLRLTRALLLRTVAVIFVFNVFMYVVTLAFWDSWSGLTVRWFHVTPESLGPLMLNFFTAVKFYAVYVLLAPTLALHWTIKTLERKGLT